MGRTIFCVLALFLLMSSASASVDSSRIDATVENIGDSVSQIQTNESTLVNVGFIGLLFLGIWLLKEMLSG